MDVLLRNRSQLAPERVEIVAVDAAARSARAGRVDEVRRADLRDVNLEARMLADERARGPGVVEMDVREQQVAEVGELEAALARRSFRAGMPVEGPQSLSASPSVVSTR